MSLLIAYPALAIVPCLIFLLLFLAHRRGVVGLAAAMWGLYTAYEYAMKGRLLCSGECNIRIDLLAIYPALLVASAVALMAALRDFRGQQPPRR